MGGMAETHGGGGLVCVVVVVGGETTLGALQSPSQTAANRQRVFTRFIGMSPSDTRFLLTEYLGTPEVSLTIETPMWVGWISPAGSPYVSIFAPPD